MDDSAERSAAHTNDESPPAPISTPTAPMPIPQSRSPFFSLPLELRRMVYRYLLVTKGDIHLDSLLGNSTPCQHNTPKICAALLRVCRLITPEALDVLYGENFFTVKADNYPDDCDRPAL